MTSASAVTVVPVSTFPDADELTGTESVPLVQDGLSKKTPSLAFADLVWEDFGNTTDRRFANNIGYLTVPPTGIASGPIPPDARGKGLLLTTAASITLSLPSPSFDYPSGYVVTLLCTNDLGEINIEGDAGATILSMNDGTTGDKTLSGIGIVTVWMIQSSPSFWIVHGSANLG